VGKRHDIRALQELDVERNYACFRDAPIHSLEGAVWNTLVMTGLVVSDAIDTDNPIFQEIVRLKDELHEEILHKWGREVPGAAHFVRALAAHGFEGRLDTASAAVRRDALISLDVVGVRSLFPDNQIITKEQFTHPKPHPEAFETAFKSLNLDVPPSQVLAFEDDPRGIMSAKAAGLYTCAITTRYTKQELAAQPVAPDLTADSFAEFEQLLGLA
jgi:beta-phosphoglucomutase-like phosphatase (HAD superfamily)